MADTVKRMDRNEIAKRVERAEKLLQKGKTAEALDDYLQVLAAEPGNDTVCQMAADLCLSLQRIPQAVKLLGDLFERQIEAGDATRASLTYKKLSRFVNPTWEQKLRFGQLLEDSHRKQALETYEAVLEELTKQGRKQDSLLVLQRILEPRIQRAESGSARRTLIRTEGRQSCRSRISETRGACANLGRERGAMDRTCLFRRSADPQIALAYGKNLLEQGQVGAAIFVFEPLVIAGGASEELRETYAKALHRGQAFDRCRTRAVAIVRGKAFPHPGDRKPHRNFHRQPSRMPRLSL